MKILTFYSVVFGSTLFYSVLLSPKDLQAEAPEIKPWFKQAVLLKSYQQSYDWLTPWEKREIRTQTGMALVVSMPVNENSKK